jgi:hypothetical protein
LIFCKAAEPNNWITGKLVFISSITNYVLGNGNVNEERKGRGAWNRNRKDKSHLLQL